MFDSRARLESVRDRLAAAIEVCDSLRDLPALSREYRATITAIDALPDAKAVDPVDEITAARNKRRSVG